MTALPADPGIGPVCSQPASDTNCGTAIAPFARRPSVSTGTSIPSAGIATRRGAPAGKTGLETNSGGGNGRFRPRPPSGGPGTPTAKHSRPASVCAVVSKTPTPSPPGVATPRQPMVPTPGLAAGAPDVAAAA